MKEIIVSHATANNLKDVSVRIPLHQFVTFIGKSGSGKSTLAVDVIYQAYLGKSDCVQTAGKAALLKQNAFQNQRNISVLKYLTGTERGISGGTLVDLSVSQIVKRVISMLDMVSVPLSAPVSELSLTTYHKLRFVKMLLVSDADVFIVDELAAGLTFHEAQKVAKAFQLLVKNGYTVLAIEHSVPIIEASDYVVELGPDAGVLGGEVLYCGDFSSYSASERWKDIKRIGQGKIQNHTNLETSQNQPVFKKRIGIPDINFRCLRLNYVELPLNAIVNICGASGSGKTSMLDVIQRALDKSPQAWKNRTGIGGEITGKQYMRRCYVIDQSPIGNNSMSTPATYTGIMDYFRKRYAEASKVAGFPYTVSDFSYCGNYTCPVCHGKGYTLRVEEENELFMPCAACAGKRFTRELLRILDCHMSLGDVLQIPCGELLNRYQRECPHAGSVIHKIQFLKDVGLSYLCLGQPSGSLSGGESQRIKITKELAKKLGDRCVFALDTPTKGLHPFNRVEMLSILRELVQKNNSVIIADNDPLMVRNADYLLVLNEGKVAYQGIPKNLPEQYQRIFGYQV